VRSSSLRPFARQLSARVRDFAGTVRSALITHQRAIKDRQYVHERIADAGCELYASSCVLARLDSMLSGGNGHDVTRAVQVGKHFLALSDRRIKQCLAALSDNDDASTTQTADAVLRG
jgi:hypothetical protein